MKIVPLDIRRSLLRQHGDFALAYSVTFQPEMEHFGDEDGFLSYKTIGGTALVLSNPVAPPDKRKALIDRFVEEKGDVCFWQISRPVAEILAGMGFSINELGAESHIDLAAYNFAGSTPAKRNSRRAYGRALNHGYATRECSTASLNQVELEAVSVKWRQTRSTKNRETTFLVRPVVLADEPDVRKFFTFDRYGHLMAFAFFDPVYEGGEVVGYLCSTRRRLPEADSLVGYARCGTRWKPFSKNGRSTCFLACLRWSPSRIGILLTID